MQRKLERFETFLGVLDRLRAECPWDKEQTWDSLRTMTIEEVYELADAIAMHDEAIVKYVLGDVLVLVGCYAMIADELGIWDIGDVVEALTQKLIYRHPHVFGEEQAADAKAVSELWEKRKLKEKDGNKTVLGGVPRSLPALIKAYRIQGKAKGVGFDWGEAGPVWDKLSEEIGEFKAEVERGDKEAMEKEFGDILFSVVNLARHYKINPENALEMTNQKFIRRFNFLEQKTLQQGVDLKSLSLEQMDAIWNEAKAQEKKQN